MMMKVLVGIAAILVILWVANDFARQARVQEALEQAQAAQEQERRAQERAELEQAEHARQRRTKEDACMAMRFHKKRATEEEVQACLEQARQLYPQGPERFR